MDINMLLLWLLQGCLPWHLGWLTNWSHQSLFVAIHTLQCNHKYCTMIQAAFLVFSPKTLLEYSPFLLLDYSWRLPMTPNRQLPCWRRKNCTMALAICPGSSAGSGSFQELPSRGLTELTYILKGFQRYISPTAFRSFHKPGVPKFGMGAHIAEEPQIPIGKAAV